MWVYILGEGNGNPLQYFCLENPVDRGAWWAAVYGVTQSWTRLKQLSMHACIGEGNGNPLQYSCLENTRDRGAWWASAYEVAQSRTWLKWLSSSSSSSSSYILTLPDLSFVISWLRVTVPNLQIPRPILKDCYKIYAVNAENIVGAK